MECEGEFGSGTTWARLQALLTPHATPAKASTYTYSMVQGCFRVWHDLGAPEVTPRSRCTWTLWYTYSVV